VRVKYLRNPYFDDHFDLRDPKLLVGKTLATLGTTFQDTIGWTYQLVGWGLYQKWDKAIRTLEQILKGQQKPAVFREGVGFTFYNFLPDIHIIKHVNKVNLSCYKPSRHREEVGAALPMLGSGC
jgi:hypothetical protein